MHILGITTYNILRTTDKNHLKKCKSILKKGLTVGCSHVTIDLDKTKGIDNYDGNYS